MSRICTLPLTLRLHMVKKLQINTFNRNLCNSTRLLTNNLTLKPQSEFHHRQAHQITSLFDSRKFYTPPINEQIAWRSYATQGNPPNSNNKPASSGNDDDDHLYEDEDLAVFDEGDDEIEYKSDDKKSVPSINTVPDYFPKVPIIATAYPVFPKFMKVFEVTDPNLIKLLEWVRLKIN